MKRIILSILSVFITLGAAAETGQALPAVQRAATAAVEETPSGKEGSVPPETSDTPGTGTEATTETTSGLAAETDTATAAGTLGTLGAPAAPSAPMPAAAGLDLGALPAGSRLAGLAGQCLGHRAGGLDAARPRPPVPVRPAERLRAGHGLSGQPATSGCRSPYDGGKKSATGRPRPVARHEVTASAAWRPAPPPDSRSAPDCRCNARAPGTGCRFRVPDSGAG